jgi:acyl-coenzyme A synthetase/AMP-(fatty) acid ligase
MSALTSGPVAMPSAIEFLIFLPKNRSNRILQRYYKGKKEMHGAI